jgi:YesN/AraC family two-component response regulator
VAYSRGDAYIQDILDCKTVADAAHIGHTMYDDFIHLVHKGRANPDLSPQIQSCCDYIELHAEEKLSLSDLASHIGYADYYLSRKFKTETGFSINDYIKIVKVEKAKTLLLSSDMSIQGICERLQFGSRSFFAETFKEIAGIPPAAFREQNRKR